MELILWVAQGPAVPPFMYNRMNRMLLCSSGNSECLILRQREHSTLKWSRSSWAPENGEGVATLGGFGVGTGAALGWGGGGDWLRQASWAWRAVTCAVSWAMCSSVDMVGCWLGVFRV